MSNETDTQADTQPPSTQPTGITPAQALQTYMQSSLLGAAFAWTTLADMYLQQKNTQLFAFCLEQAETAKQAAKMIAGAGPVAEGM